MNLAAIKAKIPCRRFNQWLQCCDSLRKTSTFITKVENNTTKTAKTAKTAKKEQDKEGLTTV